MKMFRVVMTIGSTDERCTPTTVGAEIRKVLNDKSRALVVGLCHVEKKDEKEVAAPAQSD